MNVPAAEPGFLTTLPTWTVVAAILGAVLTAVVSPLIARSERMDLRSRIAKDVDLWSKLPASTTPLMDTSVTPPTPVMNGTVQVIADGPKELLQAHIGRLVDELTTSGRDAFRREARRAAKQLGITAILFAIAVVLFYIAWHFSGGRSQGFLGFLAFMAAGLVVATLTTVAMAAVLVLVNTARWLSTPTNR